MGTNEADAVRLARLERKKCRLNGQKFFHNNLQQYQDNFPILL
jgi:hypothetical protein